MICAFLDSFLYDIVQPEAVPPFTPPSQKRKKEKKKEKETKNKTKKEKEKRVGLL